MEGLEGPLWLTTVREGQRVADEVGEVSEGKIVLGGPHRSGMGWSFSSVNDEVGGVYGADT